MIPDNSGRLGSQLAGKMGMLEIIYGVVCLAMLVIMLFLIGYSIHAFWIGRRHSLSQNRSVWPKAALIIPCKGTEPDLEENLRRHFHHDYPDYQIIFTLADADDPAVAVIQTIIAHENVRPATVVLAPR